MFVLVFVSDTNINIGTTPIFVSQIIICIDVSVSLSVYEFSVCVRVSGSKSVYITILCIEKKTRGSMIKVLFIYLSFGRRIPKINENIRKLQNNSNSINSDKRKIFPFVANYWQSIPSEKETVQQSYDVRNT